MACRPPIRANGTSSSVTTTGMPRLLDKFGLTDYLVRRFAIIGPPEVCVERLREIIGYGVRNISLSLLSRTCPARWRACAPLPGIFSRRCSEGATR